MQLYFFQDNLPCQQQRLVKGEILFYKGSCVIESSASLWTAHALLRMSKDDISKFGAVCYCSVSSSIMFICRLSVASLNYMLWQFRILGHLRKESRAGPELHTYNNISHKHGGKLAVNNHRKARFHLLVLYYDSFRPCHTPLNAKRFRDHPSKVSPKGFITVIVFVLTSRPVLIVQNALQGCLAPWRDICDPV